MPIFLECHQWKISPHAGQNVSFTIGIMGLSDDLMSTSYGTIITTFFMLHSCAC